MNTTRESAKALFNFTQGLSVNVNIIPWNRIDGLEWDTPSRDEIRAFTRMLDTYHISYTLRLPKGRGISGACGQLATSTRRNED